MGQWDDWQKGVDRQNARRSGVDMNPTHPDAGRPLRERIAEKEKEDQDNKQKRGRR